MSVFFLVLSRRQKRPSEKGIGFISLPGICVYPQPAVLPCPDAKKGLKCVNGFSCNHQFLESSKFSFLFFSAEAVALQLPFLFDFELRTILRSLFPRQADLKHPRVGGSYKGSSSKLICEHLTAKLRTPFPGVKRECVHPLRSVGAHWIQQTPSVVFQDTCFS